MMPIVSVFHNVPLAHDVLLAAAAYPCPRSTHRQVLLHRHHCGVRLRVARTRRARPAATCFVTAVLFCPLVAPRAGCGEEPGGQSAHPTQTDTQDLTCSASMRFAGPHEHTIELGCRYYAKPPDRCKLTILSRTASDDLPDLFQDKIGIVFIRRGSTLTWYNPFSEKLTSTSLDTAKTGPITRIYGSGGVPDVTAHVAASLCMGDLSHWQAVDGVAPQVRFAAAEPIVPVQPHGVSGVSVRADPEQAGAVVAECLDAEGKVVATTTYSDFRDFGPERRLPMRSVTRVTEGVVTVQHEVIIQEGKPDERRELASAQVPYPARTIEARYTVVQGHRFPELVTVKDEQGNGVMEAEFRDYRINQGLSDEIFEFPAAMGNTPREPVKEGDGRAQ